MSLSDRAKVLDDGSSLVTSDDLKFLVRLFAIEPQDIPGLERILTESGAAAKMPMPWLLMICDNERTRNGAASLEEAATRVSRRLSEHAPWVDSAIEAMDAMEALYQRSASALAK